MNNERKKLSEIGLINPITATDSYKIGGHWAMLPDGTQAVYSYDEARIGAKYPYTVWAGLQTILKRLKRITMDDVENAAYICQNHFMGPQYFNYQGWKAVVLEYGGYLPVEIRSVDEGTKVPVGNVHMTITNIGDKRFNFVTNHIESILTHVWYPSNVATKSAIIKENIIKNFRRSSDLPIEVQDEIAMFLLHDFGFRGAACPEAGAIGGVGHLFNFYGTDTVPALELAHDMYDADLSKLGFSCAATEHSIATAYGLELQDEITYVKTMMEKFPTGILSIVGDSRDITRFVNVVIRNLKDDIIKRWENGSGPVDRVVVRPDSPRWEGDTPYAQVKWIFDTLYDIFGGEINSKGRKVLHPCVGCIYGDGLSEEEIFEIYDRLSDDYDIYNCVVGQGGGLLQKHNRDTQRKAIKCSAQKRNGEWIDIFKNPLDKSKASKRGRLALINDRGEYKTIRIEDLKYHENLLKLRYRAGELFNVTTFDEIRERLKA